MKGNVRNSIAECGKKEGEMPYKPAKSWHVISGRLRIMDLVAGSPESLTAVFDQDVTSVASEATKPVEAPFRGGGLRDNYRWGTLNAGLKMKAIRDKSMSGWAVFLEEVR